MKFTIIGASGFIGTRLVASLNAKGHEVYAPQRGDMRTFDQNLGHVIYCAGVTSDFRSRPYDTVAAHITFLGEVLQKSAFDSLLYVSSTRIYLGATSTSELAECRVNSSRSEDLYNLTKLTGESLCLACGREKVRVARLSNLFDADWTSHTFLSELLRAAILSRSIVLRSSLSSSKDYILIEDVMSLLPRIAMEGKHCIYNVATGVNLSNKDLVEKLSEITGSAVTVEPEAQSIIFPEVSIERVTREFSPPQTNVLVQLPEIVQEMKRKNGYQH